MWTVKCRLGLLVFAIAIVICTRIFGRESGVAFLSVFA